MDIKTRLLEDCSRLYTNLMELRPYVGHHNCSYDDSLTSTPDGDFCDCGVRRRRMNVQEAYDALKRTIVNMEFV